MVTADASYAASVASGKTTAWAIPKQQYTNTNPGQTPTLVGTDWFVDVDARCDPVLTTQERAAIE